MLRRIDFKELNPNTVLTELVDNVYLLEHEYKPLSYTSRPTLLSGSDVKTAMKSTKELRVGTEMELH